jgi:hypothetical protein
MFYSTSPYPGSIAGSYSSVSRSMTSPDSASQASTATATSTASTSRLAKRLFGSPDRLQALGSPDRGTTDPVAIMRESVRNPQVLIGCRIFISGKGQGTITGMQKKKFHSTTFKILFDNDRRRDALLKLRRRADKAGEEFQILPHIRAQSLLS